MPYDNSKGPHCLKEVTISTCPMSQYLHCSMVETIEQICLYTVFLYISIQHKKDVDF